MKNEILINAGGYETRVAWRKDGVLIQIEMERAARRDWLGNVYLGRILRVLPGMRAAFVDIGAARSAFLHANELVRAPNESADDALARLRAGQTRIVQMMRSAIGDKGARLSEQISLPSRHLLYLPTRDALLTARRLDENARQLCLEKLLRLRGDARIGLLARYTAQHARDDELRVELAKLTDDWQTIIAQAARAAAPTLLHRDLPLALRAVRDADWHTVTRVLIDCPKTLMHAQRIIVGDDVVDNNVVDAVGNGTGDGVGDDINNVVGNDVNNGVNEVTGNSVVDTVANDANNNIDTFTVDNCTARIELHHARTPIFDLYDTEAEIERALARRVELPGGGHLVFDRTEAMHTIDVNSGGLVGADIGWRANWEAARVIARQIRLRNLGGIIVADFIDMQCAEQRQQLWRRLADELAADPTPTRPSPMSALGLVEISRRRNGESLQAMLLETCAICDGGGAHKSAQSICYEIFREILRGDCKKCAVRAAPTVIAELQGAEAAHLQALAESTGKQIRLHDAPNWRVEQYVVLADG